MIKTWDYSRGEWMTTTWNSHSKASNAIFYLADLKTETRGTREPTGCHPPLHSASNLHTMNFRLKSLETTLVYQPVSFTTPGNILLVPFLFEIGCYFMFDWQFGKVSSSLLFFSFLVHGTLEVNILGGISWTDQTCFLIHLTFLPRSHMCCTSELMTGEVVCLTCSHISRGAAVRQAARLQPQFTSNTWGVRCSLLSILVQKQN